MNTVRKKLMIRVLTASLILLFCISCNSIFHKKSRVYLWKEYYKKPPHLDNDYCDPTYAVVEKFIDKQRKKNYVISLQYVWEHYKYNKQLDFVWSIPETNDNRIKLYVFYTPDIKKIPKLKKIVDEYTYHGSLAWLRDIRYDKIRRDKVLKYVYQAHETVRNMFETNFWYKDVHSLLLPSIEDVEHFRTDTISNDFIKGYCELIKGLMIPVMTKYSEELKIPRPDFSNYYLHLDTIQ